MNLRNINLDRRHKFRRVLDKFAFLQIERDDGGTVLDVSEGGLRFETFAPVLQEGPVHCWFSLNLRERIEAWGEVVWTNREKKYGGLRFLQVSEKGRGLIRECISQQTQRPIADEEYERGVGVGRAARIGVSEPDAVARFVAKARPRQGAPSNGHTIPHTWQAPAANPPTSGRHTIPRAGGAPATNLPASDGQTIPRAWEAAAANPPSFEEHTIPRAWQAPAENPPARVPLASFSGAADAGGSSTLFPPPKEMAAGRELVPAQRYHAAKRRQLILGLIFGTFVSGTVAAAIVKYSNPRHENTSAAKATAELDRKSTRLNSSHRCT